jgi:hypothetical protein
MLVAVGFDLSPFFHAVSTGAGKVVAALMVAAIAYLIFAAALWLMRSAGERGRGSDVSGFVLITGLMLYVIVGLLMDAAGFAMLSAGLVGIAMLAVLLGELRTAALRMRDLHHGRHVHGH